MTKKVKTKATSHDFELFCNEASYWLDRFGIYSYHVSFAFKKAWEQSRASCEFDTENRFGIITLYKDWGGDAVTEDAVKRAAFHEVMELLLGKLRVLCDSDGVRENTSIEEVHIVIRTLENAVFSYEEDDDG